MSRRASAPVVAVALLVLVAVGLAGVVAAGLGALAPPTTPPSVGLDVSADAGADRIALTHLGGDPVGVDRLRLRVLVDGTPLAHQPRVPFFAARGFRAGPTGPFNSASDPRWTPGETASLRLASTNEPPLDAGARLRVEVYSGDHRIAVLSTVAT